MVPLTGAADASGTAATRTVPASRAAPIEPRATSTQGGGAATAPAVAPAATANGNNEGQGTIADALHRFLRPSAFHRPAAAAPALPRQASRVPPLQSLPSLRPGPTRELSPASAAPCEGDGAGSLPAGQDHSHVAGNPQQQQQQEVQEQAGAPNQVVEQQHNTTAPAAAAREAAAAFPHSEQLQVPLKCCLQCADDWLLSMIECVSRMRWNSAQDVLLFDKGGTPQHPFSRVMSGRREALRRRRPGRDRAHRRCRGRTGQLW